MAVDHLRPYRIPTNSQRNGPLVVLGERMEGLRVAL